MHQNQIKYDIEEYADCINKYMNSECRIEEVIDSKYALQKSIDNVINKKEYEIEALKKSLLEAENKQIDFFIQPVSQQPANNLENIEVPHKNNGKLIFPTVLRKMWTGAEIQEWLDNQPNNNLELQKSLWLSIKHGDLDHQEWLKSAINAHFAGSQIPVYIPQPNNKPVIENAIRALETLISEMSSQDRKLINEQAISIGLEAHEQLYKIL